MAEYLGEEGFLHAQLPADKIKFISTTEGPETREDYKQLLYKAIVNRLF